MNCKRFFCIIFTCLLIINSNTGVFAQHNKEEKMQWWREARFGMMICWGVYSVYENKYTGLDVNGNGVNYNRASTGIPSEWIMFSAKIPRTTYREAAKEFDAIDFDPKKWVNIAKEAGTKYIVITAKHHDGFCLFDSKYTDWDAVDASAAKRDLLKDLVKEAKAAGLKIGFYYSQNLDWMHEGGMGEVPELNGQTYTADKVEKYVKELAIPQIKELTSNYDIDIFWFDVPNVSNGENRLFKAMMDTLLQSEVGDKIIINDRLSPEFSGDFNIIENDTPRIPYNGWDNAPDWEACTSLNNSWGYEKTPLHKWKSPLFTISRILEIVSKGGNFLLNVGPDKHGNIPEQAVSILKEVGSWLEKNGNAVYGTTKNELLNPFEYGYVTQKNNADGSVNLYLHVSASYWDEAKIYLDGIKEIPQKASFLATGESVNVEQAENGLVFDLPEKMIDSHYSVIDLHFPKMPEQVYACPLRDEKIRLTPYQAVTSNVKKDFIPYTLNYWFGNGPDIEFDVYLEPGRYSVQIEYAALDDGDFYIDLNGETYTLPYQKTNNPGIVLEDYIIDEYPETEINIHDPSIYKIAISRKVNGFNVPGMRKISLIRDSNTSSIPISEEQHFNFFPNPAKTELFVSVTEPQQVKIYDLTGKLCLTQYLNSHSNINISSLNAGTYMIKGKGKAQLLIVTK